MFNKTNEKMVGNYNMIKTTGLSFEANNQVSAHFRRNLRGAIGLKRMFSRETWNQNYVAGRVDFFFQSKMSQL